MVGAGYSAPTFLWGFWGSLRKDTCVRLFPARSLFRDYPFLLHLSKEFFRVLLEAINAGRATEVNSLPLIIGIELLVDLAALDRAGGLLGPQGTRFIH